MFVVLTIVCVFVCVPVAPVVPPRGQEDEDLVVWVTGVFDFFQTLLPVDVLFERYRKWFSDDALGGFHPPQCLSV